MFTNCSFTQKQYTKEPDTYNPIASNSGGGRRTRRRRPTRKRQSKPMVNLQANRKRTRAVAVRGKRCGRISKR